MPGNDKSSGKQDRKAPAKPTRDARGRWLKGHCPNRKGRPRRKPKEDPDPGDIRDFGREVIEVRTNGRIQRMDRRTALLLKMFEAAMNGKVSMQKYLYEQLERGEEDLAELRARYHELVIKAIIRNPRFGDPGYQLPIEIQTELLALKRVLQHFFPEDYDDF